MTILDVGAAGKLDPIGMRREIAAIVGVARGTVYGQKMFRVHAQDARQARNSVRRRARAENFAVVENHGADFSAVGEWGGGSRVHFSPPGGFSVGFCELAH